MIVPMPPPQMPIYIPPPPPMSVHTLPVQIATHMAVTNGEYTQVTAAATVQPKSPPRPINRGDEIDWIGAFITVLVVVVLCVIAGKLWR